MGSPECSSCRRKHSTIFSASKQPGFQSTSDGLVIVLLPTTKKDGRALRFLVEGFKSVKKRDNRDLYHPLPLSLSHEQL